MPHQYRKMKYFLFCEIQDGGMSEALYVFTSDEPVKFPLTGWMSPGCEVFDSKLVEWAKSARIGEFYSHRLGVCIRVLDPDTPR
jgi:hypothetical protein